MPTSPYLPIFELTRGKTVESIHHGAVAVVDVQGNLVASYADPYTITFLRSTAKPFQALPLITRGGQSFYDFTPREIALMCASHSGTDEHVAIANAIQTKAGVTEADLLCGVHYPYHEPTTDSLKERKEKPTPNRHNCSGKHSGMLAFARMSFHEDADVENLPYIDPHHPVQQEILRTFAEMTGVAQEDVQLGTDGCSAPNFAIPLYNAALGFARLVDPEAGAVEPVERAAACRVITSAMMFNADMVGGPGRFDTRLMEAGLGNIVSKGGAEGYQGIGLLPGVLGEGSPGIGIAIKIADGDARARVRSAVAMEVLRQLRALSEAQLGQLSDFGPSYAVYNWRKIEVGAGYPTFQLQRHQA